MKKAKLMHKDIVVASLLFDDDGYLKKILAVYEETHLPVMAQENTLSNLWRWFVNRTPDKKRENYVELKNFFGTEKLLPKYFASLFDTYWVCPDKEDLHWSDISLHKHFSCDEDSIDEILLQKKERSEINTHSPNLTIPGDEERFWMCEQGKFYLLSLDAQKEMELYKIAKLHNLSVASRTYLIQKDHLFAKIEMPVTENIELIPLDEYYSIYKKSKKKNKAQNLYCCCEHFGIPDYKIFFEQMMRLDDLCGYTDRELNEIYVMRDSDSLQILSLAPV